MSYPFVGIQGVFPEYEKWDAASIERALRDGHHIYFDECTCIAYVEDGKFQFLAARLDDREEKVRFASESFLEFAAWVAFYGRDIL